jgi:hypothetical protein
MRRLIYGLVSCLVVAACSPDRRYPPRTFTWSGDVPAGGTVKVRNVDGSIAVVPATNNQLSVSALIVNASPTAVQVKPEMTDSVLTFCTLLGSSSNDTCGEKGHGHSSSFSPWSLFNRHHPITVVYTLHVPAGVAVDLETVKGRIAAQDVGGNVKAETVTGDVVVSTTSGTVNAETVNGSIIASMAALPDSGNVHLETVNGSITSVLPAGMGGLLNLENVNGKITANYPHPAADSADAHHLVVRLSPSSRKVHLETVNGSVNVTQYSKPVSVSLSR